MLFHQFSSPNSTVASDHLTPSCSSERISSTELRRRHSKCAYNEPMRVYKISKLFPRTRANDQSSLGREHMCRIRTKSEASTHTCLADRCLPLDRRPNPLDPQGNISTRVKVAFLLFVSDSVACDHVGYSMWPTELHRDRESLLVGLSGLRDFAVGNDYARIVLKLTSFTFQ